MSEFSDILAKADAAGHWDAISRNELTEALESAEDEIEWRSRAWGVTADDEPFSNGSKVYYVDPCGFVQGLDVGLSFHTDDSRPSPVYSPYPIYSTRDAADAARRGD